MSGVMDDIDNSIFPSEWDVLVPFENMKYINDAADMDDPNMRNSGSCILFMRTVKHADLNDKAADVAAYLKTVFWPYRHGSLKEAHFIPIHDFYFSETESVMLLNQYSFKKVVIFLTVGILILLMAVFNYVSMSVAQTSYRAKEMATRRLLGSTRRDIFWRMILESVLLTAFAFMLGFLFAKAAEPYAEVAGCPAGYCRKPFGADPCRFTSLTILLAFVPVRDSSRLPCFRTTTPWMW